jgi:uncharacterized membrane protein
MVEERKPLARSVISLADKRRLWDVEAAVATPVSWLGSLIFGSS